MVDAADGWSWWWMMMVDGCEWWMMSGNDVDDDVRWMVRASNVQFAAPGQDVGLHVQSVPVAKWRALILIPLVTNVCHLWSQRMFLMFDFQWWRFRWTLGRRFRRGIRSTWQRRRRSWRLCLGAFSGELRTRRKHQSFNRQLSHLHPVQLWASYPKISAALVVVE